MLFAEVAFHLHLFNRSRNSTLNLETLMYGKDLDKAQSQKHFPTATEKYIKRTRLAQNLFTQKLCRYFRSIDYRLVLTTLLYYFICTLSVSHMVILM